MVAAVYTHCNAWVFNTLRLMLFGLLLLWVSPECCSNTILTSIQLTQCSVEKSVLASCQHAVCLCLLIGQLWTRIPPHLFLSRRGQSDPRCVSCVCVFDKGEVLALRTILPACCDSIAVSACVLLTSCVRVYDRLQASTPWHAACVLGAIVPSRCMQLVCAAQP